MLALWLNGVAPHALSQMCDTLVGLWVEHRIVMLVSAWPHIPFHRCVMPGNLTKINILWKCTIGESSESSPACSKTVRILPENPGGESVLHPVLAGQAKHSKLGEKSQGQSSKSDRVPGSSKRGQNPWIHRHPPRWTMRKKPSLKMAIRICAIRKWETMFWNSNESDSRSIRKMAWTF